ncbi:MAG TPA: sigma-70 family RNA polymerase sigma factor, partial [Planctomycetota bacterium]|nr:sigma-70 family RNA polymerase sigma factor [Planctomycetota bacterium]
MREAFTDFKSDPTSDNLIRLLRAHQDRVYRLCLQVLRRPHDAEDAAQEVLMRMADGARGIDDADAFRRWVWRVSLNAALESARKAARRRVHESRAAMKPPAAAPLDDESRRALFEGIAKLDDGPRALLLDHYVEGETLESIAAREGVSPQAVSKRLERTREDLRRALPASMAAALDWGRVFEPGLGASPDLVTGAVLAKVAAVAGGAAMTTKSVLLPAVVAVFLVLSAGGGLWVATKSWRAPSPPDAKSGKAASSRQDASLEPATAAILTPADLPADVPPPTLSPLRIRLDQFRSWWLAKEKS